MKLKRSLKGVKDIRYAGDVRVIRSKDNRRLHPLISETKVPDEEPQEPKGRFNGRCNVTGCQRPGSRIFMPIENAYYCVSCTRKMHEWDLLLQKRGEQDWLRFPDGLVEDEVDRRR